jgi:prepilin-type N-terminal cleavage/methylation domain-containing protein
MLKKFFVKNKKGFSLIEMMVVVVVMGLIILALVTFFTSGTRSWITGQSQLSAQRNARQAMDWMVREIREASNIIATTTSSKKINFTNSWSPESLTFTYFDTSNVEVIPTLTDDTAAKISKVHINLQVDVDKDSSPDITLNSDINLRNFGL